ncbi:hypothetical protein, partial [Klebsiella pneumoniae]|uniref:hypothetical protein n=1 Tax=Klebsiella pneumoniae TaxID=573 RepID=UPI00396F4DB9
SGCFNELQFIKTVRAFRESDPSRTAKERAFLAVVKYPYRCGDGGWIRTTDQLINSQPLYH